MINEISLAFLRWRIPISVFHAYSGCIHVFRFSLCPLWGCRIPCYLHGFVNTRLLLVVVVIFVWVGERSEVITGSLPDEFVGSLFSSKLLFWHHCYCYGAAHICILFPFLEISRKTICSFRIMSICPLIIPSSMFEQWVLDVRIDRVHILNVHESGGLLSFTCCPTIFLFKVVRMGFVAVSIYSSHNPLLLTGNWVACSWISIKKLICNGAQNVCNLALKYVYPGCCGLEQIREG